MAFLSPNKALEKTLEGERFRVARPEQARIWVVSGDHEPVSQLVSFVLAGSGLIICGGEGPLLWSLHLLRLPGGAVSGVGYVLRPGAAIAAPRGSGQVVWLGEDLPDADLFRQALDWCCQGHAGSR